jgi:hypothetical protein
MPPPIVLQVAPTMTAGTRPHSFAVPLQLFADHDLFRRPRIGWASASCTHILGRAASTAVQRVVVISETGAVATLCNERGGWSQGGRLGAPGITPPARLCPSPAFPVSSFPEHKESWQRSSQTCRAFRVSHSAGFTVLCSASPDSFTGRSLVCSWRVPDIWRDISRGRLFPFRMSHQPL